MSFQTDPEPGAAILGLQGPNTYLIMESTPASKAKMQTDRKWILVIPFKLKGEFVYSSVTCLCYLNQSGLIFSSKQYMPLNHIIL